MNKHDVLNKITKGAKGLNILSIEYLEKDGTNEGPRLVEPYSMRDTGTEKEAFFGFDIAKDGIRRFTVERIQNVEITDERFTPRNGWAVEF
jgi:predicted DNA-binding transcriptional regulator YafY